MEVLARFGEIAGKVAFRVFESAVLKIVFIIDEKHFEIAITENVDLLAIGLIHGGGWLKHAQSLVSRFPQVKRKITFKRSLKWLKEKRPSYYRIIVNVPEPDGEEEKIPPPGADPERLRWWRGNVKRIINFVFDGKITKTTKDYGVMHLKWLKKVQELGGTVDPDGVFSQKDMIKLQQTRETAKKEGA